MSRVVVADLHVHTLLSPCAAVEMTPRHIIQWAKKLGVEMLAITDHNAGDNVAAALKAAAGTGVVVLPGMEVTSREEVHVVTLFADWEQFVKWVNLVNKWRTGQKNDVNRFGAQFIVDANDNFVANNEELLLAALTVDLATVVRTVADIGGISIAAHVDRPAYSIISQLGFIPSDSGLAAVEVSQRSASEAVGTKLGELPVITASDAHTMADFIAGSRTLFRLAQPTLAELKLALSGVNDREIVGWFSGGLK